MWPRSSARLQSGDLRPSSARLLSGERRPATLAAIAAVVIAAGPLAARQQAPFRGGADLVSVYLTATDPEGRLVTNLRADEVEVFDNGKKQPVEIFTGDIQPFSVVVMLDRSGSMVSHFDLVRDGAIEFVRQMLPADRARIGDFSNRIVIRPEAFTSDRDALIRVLTEDLQDVGPSPVWMAIDRAMTAALPEPGRRVVLVFSDGHDDPPRRVGITRLDDLLRRVRANDVMVYAIGFVVTSTQVQVQPRVRPGQIPPPRLPGFPPPRGLPQPTRRVTVKEKREDPDPGLKALAVESGGGYFELDPTQNLAATFTRVAEELHRQYLVGFRPPKLDGKLHEIEVRVKRRGVAVRARKTYLAYEGDR
jgi:VWFA-related protein